VKTLADVFELERPLLGFDLETTGVKPETARIVELGLEIYAPGKPVKEYETRVNPGEPIPPGATAVHGITDAQVAEAYHFDQLADNLLKGFTGADFAGYNVRFDLRIVAAEFARCGKTFDYESARIIDGHRLWQVLEGRSLDHAWDYWILGKDAVERRKTALEEILAQVGDGASHSALWDVKRSTRVIAAQILHSPMLPRNVQAIHDLLWADWFDAEGKLKWRDGALAFSFGAHRDVPLQRVPKDYLRWVTRQGFSRKVRETCADAMCGVFPTPPAGGADAEPAR
jgi:DNA polymerase-3 subunit epsilon